MQIVQFISVIKILDLEIATQSEIEKIWPGLLLDREVHMNEP